MKNPTKTKAIRLIEDFDKQLREILSEELRSLRSVKSQLISNLRAGNTDEELLVA